jgi:hypothetical protein
MAGNSAVRHKDILKNLDSSGTCGSCTYSWVDGGWKLNGLGTCVGTCSCAAKPSVVQMVVRQIVYPKTVRSIPDAINSKTVFCSSGGDALLADDELIAAVRRKIESGPFWMRVSLGLFIVTLLLLAGLIYVLFLR